MSRYTYLTLCAYIFRSCACVSVYKIVNMVTAIEVKWHTNQKSCNAIIFNSRSETLTHFCEYMWGLPCNHIKRK